MLLWAFCAAPLYYGWGRLARILPVAQPLPLVLAGAVAVSLGLVQSVLLARFRARIRFWPLALPVGWLVSMLLTVPVTTSIWGVPRTWEDLQRVSWTHTIAWGATKGLSVGVALGFALWGRRWSPVWMPWLAGTVVLETGTSLLLHAYMSSQNADAENVALALAGAIVAAGTGWLLDRLVFKPGTSSRA
jgi:hypothetical protein